MSILSIKRTETKRIENHFGYFPFAWRLSDGQIILKLSTGKDVNPTEEEELQFYSEESKNMTADDILQSLKSTPDNTEKCNDFTYWFVRSKDNGKTWEDYAAPAFTSLCELKDGSLIGLYQISRRDEKGHCIKLWRSYDKGNSWIGPEYAPLTCPPCSFGWMSSSKNSGVYFHRSIVELDCGSLLATAYTFFPQDKYMRVVIFRSDDKGKSFYYYSTLVNPAVNEKNIETFEGMTEPVIERLDNGELICVIRTGSYLPLLKSFSYNQGATWSEPEMLGVDGVDPDLQLLKNGVLACSYGRPDVWVMFSENSRGKYWNKKIPIWKYPSEIMTNEKGHRWDLERSCCYTSIIESEPGKLLLFYSAPRNADDKNIVNPWDKEQLKEFYIWMVKLEINIV